mmetsp:Transcript_11163/g.12280  ORF Transcript_11163/g.12280 Transcript_11163/m.12280 type:complete len:498 (+) Transcript_11163:3-1496(+)
MNDAILLLAILLLGIILLVLLFRSGTLGLDLFLCELENDVHVFAVAGQGQLVLEHDVVRQVQPAEGAQVDKVVQTQRANHMRCSGHRALGRLELQQFCRRGGVPQGLVRGNEGWLVLTEGIVHAVLELSRLRHEFKAVSGLVEDFVTLHALQEGVPIHPCVLNLCEVFHWKPLTRLGHAADVVGHGRDMAAEVCTVFKEAIQEESCSLGAIGLCLVQEAVRLLTGGGLAQAALDCSIAGDETLQGVTHQDEGTVVLELWRIFGYQLLTIGCLGLFRLQLQAALAYHGQILEHAFTVGFRQVHEVHGFPTEVFVQLGTVNVRSMRIVLVALVRLLGQFGVGFGQFSLHVRPHSLLHVLQQGQAFLALLNAALPLGLGQSFSQSSQGGQLLFGHVARLGQEIRMFGFLCNLLDLGREFLDFVRQLLHDAAQGLKILRLLVLVLLRLRVVLVVLGAVVLQQPHVIPVTGRVAGSAGRNQDEQHSTWLRNKGSHWKKQKET